MKLWGQPAKGRSESSSIISAERELTEISSNGDNHAEPVDSNHEAFLVAKETTRRSQELLATQGWCLWQCSALDGEIIVVVADENIPDVPEGYPVYTEGELERLFRKDISEATLRLIHEAKKLGGAKVITEVTNEVTGNES